MPRPYNYIFSLQSEEDLVDLILFLEESLTELEADEESKVYMRLVLEEACTNALTYAADPDNILIAFLLNKEQIKIDVYQTGEPYTIVPEAICENVTHGRGLPIICGLMDKVNLVKEKDWIHLEMIKDLTSSTNKGVLAYGG